MQEMFKADYITYEIVPVLGYRDVLECSLFEETKTLVFINCGGCINIVGLLSEHPYAAEDPTFLETVNILIFDSHRPIHMSNIHGNSNVYVFTDDDTCQEILGAALDTGEYAYDSASEEEYDISSNDENEEDDEEKVLVDDGHKSDSSSDNNSNNLNGGSIEGSLKITKKSQNPSHGPSQRKNLLREQVRIRNDVRREKRLEISGKVDRYYASSYHGVTSSWPVYNFCRNVMVLAKKGLWYLIVSLTYQYLYSLIGKDLYIRYYRRLSRETDRHYNQPLKSDKANPPLNGFNGMVISEESSFLQIYRDTDYRMVGLRCSNLYEGLFYSEYVASRHWTWKEKGKSTLDEFLTVMGLSQKECREKYANMNLVLRRDLKKRVLAHCDDFNLSELIYDSFFLKHSMHPLASAGDYVYSIAGNLHEIPFLSSDEEKPVFYKAKQFFKSNFLQAVDALVSDDIERGIHKCIDHQQVLYNEARLMLEGKRLIRLGAFRKGYTTTNNPLLSSPMLLMRLAHFLCETYKYSNSINLPIVIASQSVDSKYYTVCGVFGTDHDDALQNNIFGALFDTAAKHIHAEIAIEQFHTNAILIKESDLDTFMRILIKNTD